jgi:gas vesicle protein
MIGAGVGAAAALLLTPKTGEQLRDEIGEGASDRMDRVGKTVTHVGRKAQGLVD